MSYERITKRVFRCTCEKADCLHTWDAEALPTRCARCKRTGWNGVDRRKGTFKRIRKT